MTVDMRAALPWRFGRLSRRCVWRVSGSAGLLALRVFWGSVEFQLVLWFIYTKPLGSNVKDKMEGVVDEILSNCPVCPAWLREVLSLTLTFSTTGSTLTRLAKVPKHRRLWATMQYARREYVVWWH